MSSFDLIIQSSVRLTSYRELAEFVSEYNGVIRYHRDRDAKTFRVGRLHAYRINAALAADHGWPLFDVCKAHSKRLLECHSIVYEPNSYSFREPLAYQFETMDWDCLLLDYVVLHPRWRGLKIGLTAVRMAVDQLGGGCGLAVSAIEPLCRDAHKRLGVPRSWIPAFETPAAARETAHNLRCYFRRMGFRRIDKTPYYGLSLAKKLLAAERRL